MRGLRYLLSFTGSHIMLIICYVIGVGEKVQAIVPPGLAFGDKGICLENGECLIKPKSTLVYDVYLKKSAIPPP